MLKRIFCIAVMIFLTACSVSPEVKNLPLQQTESRLFKVEQFNQQNQIQQTGLLTLQFGKDAWRWVLTDALGAPKARLILTKSGWKNDGFVMPNKQAQQLFSALATALNPTQPLFEFSNINESENGRIYRIKHKTAWIIRQNPPKYTITLPDESLWQIEELNQ